MLFAQLVVLQRNGGPDPAEALARLGVQFAILAVEYTIFAFFLNTLSNCLKRVRPRARAIEPGNVWLNLIPCFNLVYIFLTVNRLAESLENEYDDRDLRDRGDYGRGVGTAMAVFAIVGHLCCILHIGTLTCLILYWVKVAEFTRELDDDDDDRYESRRSRRDSDEDRPSRRRDDDDDGDRGYRDENDDRPRRRRRWDDNDDDYDR